MLSKLFKRKINEDSIININRPCFSNIDKKIKINTINVVHDNNITLNQFNYIPLKNNVYIYNYKFKQRNCNITIRSYKAKSNILLKLYNFDKVINTYYVKLNTLIYDIKNNKSSILIKYISDNKIFKQKIELNDKQNIKLNNELQNYNFNLFDLDISLKLSHKSFTKFKQFIKELVKEI